jgi:31-O-methyltransferase
MQEYVLPNGVAMFHLHRGECMFLYEEVFVHRCYERHGLQLPPDATGYVFDVGANIGMASLFFHSQAPQAKLYCFEPIHQTFDVLRANMERLGISAKLECCALGVSKGVARMTHYPNKTTMSSLYADGAVDKATTKTFMMNGGADPDDAEFLLESAFVAESTSVLVRTLSGIIDEEHVEHIELLKIDVEKAEWDVLCGLRAEHWPKVSRVIVEVHDIDGRLSRVQELLVRHGFETLLEQDENLKGTSLYNIYAWRPRARSG